MDNQNKTVRLTLPSTDTHMFLQVNNLDEKQLDYSVAVSDNNTESPIVDGDILLVQKQDIVEHGEFGIFMIDGVRYVKRMYFKGGHFYLYSLDFQNSDVDIDTVNEFYCEGKVIKILRHGDRHFSDL